VACAPSRSRSVAGVPRYVLGSILRRGTVTGGFLMGPFVTGFLSPAAYLYYQSTRPIITDLQKKYGSDTAAITREINQWKATHPEPRATLSQVADQIDYVRKVDGLDQVGIGGESDGIT